MFCGSYFFLRTACFSDMEICEKKTFLSLHDYPVNIVNEKLHSAALLCVNLATFRPVTSIVS